MTLPNDLVANLDGPARALGLHLDERLDGVESKVAALSTVLTRLDTVEALMADARAMLESGNAALGFQKALTTRLEVLSPAEQTALFDALADLVETAQITSGTGGIA